MQDINTLDMAKVSDMIYEEVEELKANGWHEGTDYYNEALKGVAHVLKVDLETLRTSEEDYKRHCIKSSAWLVGLRILYHTKGLADPWNS
jgi:hypothetical protein